MFPNTSFIAAPLNMSHDAPPAVRNRLLAIERAAGGAQTAKLSPLDRVKFWHELTVWASQNVSAIEGANVAALTG